MAQVKVYTTDYCPYCNAAKQLLKANTIPFDEIRLDSREEMDELVAKTGHSTVPQIFINDELVGGFQELRELESSGELFKKMMV